MSPKASSIIPTLETERLLLRGHALEDFPRALQMWADPVVTRYTIGTPSTDSRTWLRILTYRGHWEFLGFGYWAVVEKASGQFIGEVGYADFKRGIESIAGIPELGWALMPEAHGKGYATEALRSVVRWGDEKFDSPKTVCMISPENIPSLRVADKIGFSEFGRGKGPAGEDVIFFSRARRFS